MGSKHVGRWTFHYMYCSRWDDRWPMKTLMIEADWNLIEVSLDPHDLPIVFKTGNLDTNTLIYYKVWLRKAKKWWDNSSLIQSEILLQKYYRFTIKTIFSLSVAGVERSAQKTSNSGINVDLSNQNFGCETRPFHNLIFSNPSLSASW